jgi:hypothetical protein
MRRAALPLLLLSSFALAHDLITAEAAERYLSDARHHRAVLASNAPPVQRAEACYRLGVMLDDIREFLNRDLAAHGEVQGLPSNYLVSQLERAGIPLAYSTAQKRYLSNSDHFSEALRLSPSGPLQYEAGYRLLQGRFYDSFESDPLTSDESWEKLQAQIALGERLQGRRLSAEQQEEVDFILAVSYVRAAGKAPAAATARSFSEKAAAALRAFESRYPDSLRTAAIPVLSERLKD